MEKPNTQRAVTPQEEASASGTTTTTSTSPKKRRKVNHGKKITEISTREKTNQDVVPWPSESCADTPTMNSMYLLPALGEPLPNATQHSPDLSLADMCGLIKRDATPMIAYDLRPGKARHWIGA